MKIIEIEKDYISYLKSFDKFVLKADGKDYKKERKYLGVVFSCNSFDYFIPFSSPDKKDDYDKDGKIRKSSMVVVRMIEKKKEENKLLGTLRLNSMIPICNKDVIKKYDILQEKDIFYKNLLFKEFNFIKENEEIIRTKAEKLYTLKVNNSKLPMLNFVCNFKLLEEKSLEYTTIKEKNKEQKKVNEEKKTKIIEKVKAEKEKPKREKRSRFRSKSKENER